MKLKAKRETDIVWPDDEYAHGVEQGDTIELNLDDFEVVGDGFIAIDKSK